MLVQENLQRKLREEREEKRRRQKEEEAKKKEKSTARSVGKPPEVTQTGCVDRLLSGIRGGSKLRQSVRRQSGRLDTRKSLRKKIQEVSTTSS